MGLFPGPGSEASESAFQGIIPSLQWPGHYSLPKVNTFSWGRGGQDKFVTHQAPQAPSTKFWDILD